MRGDASSCFSIGLSRSKRMPDRLLLSQVYNSPTTMSENGQTRAAGLCDNTRMNSSLPPHDVCYRALQAQGRALRRSAVRGREDHRNLLPPDLSRAHAEARELPLLSERRGGADLGLPPLPALPPGNLARCRCLARHLEHGVARAGADRGRRARRRRIGGRRACRQARPRRAPAAPAVRQASRRVADRRRTDATHSVCEAAHPGDAAHDGGGRRSCQVSAACAASTMRSANSIDRAPRELARRSEVRRRSPRSSRCGSAIGRPTIGIRSWLSSQRARSPA